MVLVCYTISREYNINGSSYIMGRSPSRSVIILLSLGAIGTVVVEIEWF